MITKTRYGVSSILLVASISVNAEVPVPLPFSEESVARGKTSNPAEGYAKDFGVSVADAKDRLALQEKALTYAQSLFESGPSEFVNIAIRHTPNFKITVYYEKSIDRAALTRSAPVELRKYLNFNPINKSRTTLDQERASIADALRAANLPFGLEFDFETARFGLEIPEGADAAKYTSAIPQTLIPKIDIRRNNLAVDVAAIYGGWSWSNGTGNCTTGWPIRDSAGKEAILTAGHCVPPNSMTFPWLSGSPTLTTVSARGSDTTLIDYAMFTLGTHTTSRVINIQNESSFVNADGTKNFIPGITTAYYEITAPVIALNGAYVCKQGKTTLLTCGSIVDTSYSDSKGSNLVKVSKSSQGNIGMSGDSGGPVFIWFADGSQVKPLGIVKGANPPSTTVACKNTSTVAANNTNCFFTYTTLRNIRSYSPFTINTTGGFVSP
jgi:hypothetical protein